jgi:hypothetical protein
MQKLGQLVKSCTVKQPVSKETSCIEKVKNYDLPDINWVLMNTLW